jgi:UDP-N-acetylmuramoyl-tripeptide--D-alanyl-D-alanine ligase
MFSVKPMSLNLKNILIKPLKRGLVYALAKSYRAALGLSAEKTFIAVTGSAAKTTTTELIAAIMATRGHVVKASHENTPAYIASKILSLSHRHKSFVCEVSGGAPGLVEKAAKLVRPQISVITNVGQDHYSSYRNLESTAQQKAKLVESLNASAAAVLNADDPLVFEMRNKTRAAVLTFGLSDNAMVRGKNVSSIWPQTMSLDVSFDKNTFHIQTQLLGEHWACAVLACLAAATAAGVPIPVAVETIERFEPIPYRMCPYKLPDGVTFICDTWKGALWTVPFSLDFMRKAKAKRKIAVIGSIADTPKSFFHRYQRIIRQSLDIVDLTIFAGEHALTALRAKPTPEDNRVIAFDSLKKLDSFLSNFLEPGDLVLLKGVENFDHLYRLVLSRTSPVACWRQICRKTRFCTDCPLLNAPNP